MPKVAAMIIGSTAIIAFFLTSISCRLSPLVLT
uniref:Uncharacterized protein n=1 Tax=Rhizophora mucronata TaxID=61149 RepID=A0A2P2NBJ0_RHIMU